MVFVALEVSSVLVSRRYLGISDSHLHLFQVVVAGNDEKKKEYEVDLFSSVFANELVLGAIHSRNKNGNDMRS